MPAMAPGRRGHAHGGGPSREHIILSWKGWKAFEMNSEMEYETDSETDSEMDSETDENSGTAFEMKKKDTLG